MHERERYIDMTGKWFLGDWKRAHMCVIRSELREIASDESATRLDSVGKTTAKLAIRRRWRRRRRRWRRRRHDEEGDKGDEEDVDDDDEGDE